MVSQSLRWETSRTAATKIVTCGAVYFGGYDVFYNYGDSMQRTWETLPSHNSITFYLQIKLIDQWDAGDYIDIYFDSTNFPFGNPVNGVNWWGDYFCGNSAIKDSELIVYGGLPHTSNQLTLKLVHRRVQAAGTGTLGVRDVQILINQGGFGGPFYAIYSIYYVTAIAGGLYPGCPWKTYYHDFWWGCQPCAYGCAFCYGPYASQCYRCIDGYNYDGYNCVPCDAGSNCAICITSAPNTCKYCKPPYYLIDNACVTCPAPFIRSSQVFGQCLYPCLSGEYLYADGSCYTTCDPRFTAYIFYSRALCNFPCTGTSIRYYDGVCVNLACPYPLQMIRYGSYEICEYPCPTGLLLYADGSCQNPALCVYPLVMHTYTGYHSWNACGSVCTYGLYRYNNDTCHTDCPAPLVSKNLAGILICDPPRCGPNQCNMCSSSYTCPDYYVCNVFLGSWCLFEYTYSLKVQDLRSVTNGLTFSVKVSPMMGIGEFNDDVLGSEIPGLTKGTDYTVSIEKVETGSFTITYNILTEFDETKYHGTLSYSPATLALEQDFKFPHIIFISEEVKQAASTIDATSQITFILFLIGIFGMVFGGGIASLWTSVPDCQYMYYLLYLNVDYLHHTTLYFQSLANYDLLVGSNNGPGLDIKLKGSLPDRFFDLDYSPDFIENSDTIFIQLMLMVAGFIVGSLSLKFLRYPKDISFIQKFFGYFMRIVKWNGLIRQLMTYILPLSTAIFVQIYHAVFGIDKPKLLSMILAPVSLVIIVWFLAKMWNIIRNVPGGRYEKAIYTKSFGTLWESLHLTSVGKYYFWFGSLRNILLAYVTVFFDVFPQLQIGTLVVYQCGMIVLFFECSKKKLFPLKIRHVFEDSALNIITLIEEILMLFMKVLIWVSILKKGSAPDSTMILIGWLIILPGVFTQVLQTGFSLLNQVRNRQKLWRSFRISLYKLMPTKKRKKKIFRPIARSLRLKSKRNLTTETGGLETGNDTIRVIDLIALKSIETENAKIEN